MITSIQDEIKRLKEHVLPNYDAIPAGLFAANMMRNDIAKAEKAIAEGDTVQMVKSLAALRTYDN